MAAPLGRPGLGIPPDRPLVAMIPLLAPPGRPDVAELLDDGAPVEVLEELPEPDELAPLDALEPEELVEPVLDRLFLLNGILLRPTLGYGFPELAAIELEGRTKLRIVNLSVIVIMTIVMTTVMIPAPSPLNSPVLVMLAPVEVEEGPPGAKSGGIVV